MAQKKNQPEQMDVCPGFLFDGRQRGPDKLHRPPENRMPATVGHAFSMTFRPIVTSKT